MRANVQLAPRAAAHPRPTLDAAFARDALAGLSRQHGEINGNHAIHEVCKFHGAGARAPA